MVKLPVFTMNIGPFGDGMSVLRVFWCGGSYCASFVQTEKGDMPCKGHIDEKYIIYIFIFI